MRHIHTCILGVALALSASGCAGGPSDETPDAPKSPPAGDEASPRSEAPTPKAPEKVEPPPPPDPLRHRDDLPPEKRIVIVVDGEPRIADLDAARAAGYTAVDFSDDWTPYIFEERLDAEGEVLENRYRQIYLGLANDRTDGDGRALPDNELNFLEVFGIPPSMGVVQRRFLEDEEKACHEEIDYAAMAKVDSIPFLRGGRLRSYKSRVARARRAVKKAIDKANKKGRKAADAAIRAAKKENKARQAEFERQMAAHRKRVAEGPRDQPRPAPPAAPDTVPVPPKWTPIEDAEGLVARDPEVAGTVEESMALAELATNREVAFDHVERRLKCDEHDRPRYKHKKGRFDHGLRMGVRRFQRKHKIYEYANMKGETMEMLATPPRQSNYKAFVRVLTERVVAATHILEDGTTQTGEDPPTYTGSDGAQHPIRNLVDEFVTAATSQLMLDTPDRVLAFFKRHSAEDFQTWMRVGVKFPALPEYYDGDMDLEIVIDRGDVWYDLPYNDAGKEIRQPRSRMPKLMVYLRWNDQTIRLVRWPTTIGGWRTDLAPNGYVYMRYKGSDVGDRVIRKIISGPTWVPPESTPLKSLAKRRWINGKAQGIVNYEEMGPGYLSAYGLVAGYFVIPRPDGNDVDRGIRAHGSSDYMSIRSSRRFSHGCHRLLNHLSVRLYGFVLNHRPHTVGGDQKMNAQRQFYYKEQVYQMRMPSRGFAYFLDPPMPVRVLEGRIRGKRKRPYEGYVKIPGETYPDTLPGEAPAGEDDRAGGGAVADEDDDA